MYDLSGAILAVMPPDPEPPADPECTLTLHYRGVDAPLATYFGGHSYLTFKNPATGKFAVIEGFQTEQEKLSAQVSFNGIGLIINSPTSDRSFGSVTGAFVCDWLSTLEAAVVRVKNAINDYKVFGPNSNSATRYFLDLLKQFTPSGVGSWFSVPRRAWGWGSTIQGVVYP